MASQSLRPGGGNQFGDAEPDLPALGAALWRNKWQIVRPTVLAALIAIAVVEMIVPKYLSEARVLIEGRDNVFLRPNADKDLIDRGTVDQEAVTSQVQLILSRDLASEVIDKLKLGKRPEFDPAIAGISPLKKVLGVIGVIKNPMRMTPEERVLDAYYDRLQVYPVEKSRVIVIDFLSEDPKLAAEVANTIAEAYLVRQQAAKQQQARAAGEWLAGEIETMRQKVADAEAKVEAFRANSNLLVGPNNTTLSAQSLGDVNAQLAAARAEGGRAVQGQADPGNAAFRWPARILGHSQFRAHPSALRAAGHLARAARRAVVVTARQSSAHQGAQGADRRPRQADQGRGGHAGAFVGKRCQARRRARRYACRKP
jgi:uncharacterized protein involved in exopolysaccharide biosynthesis